MGNTYWIKVLKKVAVGFIIIMPSSVFSQTKSTKIVSQEWIQYYATGTIAKNWMWSADAGYRYNELFGNPSQYLVRAALGYKVSNHLKVGTGFTHLGFYTSAKINKFEYRPYQEVALAEEFNHNLSIQHRFRIEERFFKNVVDGHVQPGNLFNFRFRYQVIMNCMILKLSAANPKRALWLNIGDEIFINGGKEIAYNTFDQNRFLVGPALSINGNLNIGIIYNYQFAATMLPGHYVHTDVFWLTIKQNFDIGKHKN